MRLVVTLLIILITIDNSYCGVVMRREIYRDKIRGKVKKVEVVERHAIIVDGKITGGDLSYVGKYSEHYDQKGNMTLFINYDSTGVLRQRICRNYDEKSRCISSENYYRNDWTVRVERNFNKKGKLIEIFCYKIGSHNDTVLDYHEKYGEKGELIYTYSDWFHQKTFFDEVTNTLCEITVIDTIYRKFNRRGLLVEKAMFRFNGVIKEYYSYRGKRLKEEKTYWERDTYIPSSIRYLTNYYKHGRVSIKKEYNDRNEQVGIRIKRCNRKGQELESLIDEPDLFRSIINRYDRYSGKIETIYKYFEKEEFYTYQRKYDEKGNCLEIIAYMNGIPITITERKITYY